MYRFHTALYLASVFCTVFFFSADGFAQMPPSSSTTSTPVPGVGHDYLGEIAETVNPSNGSVSFRLGATMPSGRGLTLPFSFAYDSNGVNYVTRYPNGAFGEWQTPPATIVSTGGWSESAPIVSATEITWTAIDDNGGQVHCYGFVNYVYQDDQGNRHNLNLSNYSGNTQSSACTYDTLHWPGGFGGTVATQGGEGNDPLQGAVIASIPLGNGAGVSVGPVTVTQPDGTTLYFPNTTSADGFGSMASFVEDRNGNVVTINTPGATAGPYSYSDTLGRTVLSDSGFGVSPETVTVSGYNAQYTLRWVPLSTPTFVAPLTTVSGNCSTGLGVHVGWNQQGLSTLTLPNGKSFSFAYDSTYQVLKKVTYPTGGYVRYVWGMNAQAERGYSVYPPSPCVALYGVPVITDRYVSFDGSHEVLHQQFAYSTTWDSTKAHWTSKQTTVTTTDLVRSNTYKTVYTYAPLGVIEPPNTYGAPTNWDSVESSTAYYDTGGTTLLKTVYKTWANPRLLTSQETQYPSGPANETTWSYNSREQQTERDDYDFGVAGVGSLLRTTVTNYQAFGNSPLFTYAPSIVDRPCQVITYDSTGTSRAAETDYFYDNGSTSTPCGTAGTPSVVGAGGSSLTGHDVTNYAASSSSPRGNLTQKTQWLNTGSSPFTTYAYDETGQITSITDPNQNQTTYSYADSFLNTNTGGFTTTAGSPPSGMITNAYLTKVTRPPANGVAHITKFAYGYNDGELTQTTDENSQSATYRYNDSFGRLTESDYPDGGQTTRSFNDSVPSVTTAKLINSGSTESTTVTLDGLNHPIQSQLADPMGADSTATVYDGLGRTYESFNPTRCSTPTTNCGNESTWGFATYTYDGLGRTTKILQPDGSTAPTSYSANCTTVTDESGKARKSCVDGLGRPTTVWEDPAGLNYETDYTYDALGDLTYVNQKGSNIANARTRTFQYDSLARLTSAANPESGTILYAYDANGNVVTKTAPKPNPGSSGNVITTYSIDVLNRVTSKVYSDGTTPTAYFQYDTSENWGSPPFPQYNIIGRLTGSSVSGTPASEIFSYDAMGRVLVNPQCSPSTCGTSSFMVYATYDLAGDLTSTTDAAGTTISYGYNGADRLTAVTSSLNDSQHPGALYSLDSTYGYYPNGAIRKATFGNGFTETQAFNSRLQPCRTNVNSAGVYFSTCTDSVPTSNVLDLTLVYNAGSSDNGNVVTWSAVGRQTFARSYGYDSLNRIQTMSDSATGQACKGLSWTIDAWSNVIGQTTTAGTCYSFSATATTNNQLVGYQYDAAGNMTYDGTHHYIYDAENRIIQVDSGSTASYVYDANGRRVRKTLWGGSSWTEYSYGPNGSVQGEYNGSSWPIRYAYAGSQLIAEYNATTTEFVHPDHLGSMRLLTTVNQTFSDNMDYLPFGQQIAGGSATTHKFTGKERDTESGLDNFGARYDASSLGRFMTPDWAAKPTTVPYALFGDPQTLNLYAYVRNNPLSRADVDGHCADHYKDGTCKVNVDAATGQAGVKAGKQLEGVLNKYDKAVNALNDKDKFNVKDSNGKVTGSMTGKEIKAVWNGTSFDVTNKSFNNGGAGGGTAGTWNGDSFSGRSELTPGAVSAYANAASARNEAPDVGLNSLTFHELAHETHPGEALTTQYPVTPTISWPREQGTSSVGKRMSEAVGAPFDCSIPGGCQ